VYIYIYNIYLYCILAVEKANLATTLAGGPFTLFAPTNEAFAKIPADTLNKLLANVTALTGKIYYRVSCLTDVFISLNRSLFYLLPLSLLFWIPVNLVLLILLSY